MSAIYYGVSLQGISHTLTNKPCQDYHKCIALDNGYVIAAIADGVGSANHSDIGSKLAVDTVIDFCKENFPFDGENIKTMLYMAYNKAMLNIIKLAEEEDNNLEDYDTTLDVVVYNGIGITYGHIGDSGIIALTSTGEYQLLTKPHKGEDGISMIPLRFGSKYWIFESLYEEYAAILLATDGLLESLFAPNILKNQEQPLYISELRKLMDSSYNGVTKENVKLFEEQVKTALSDEEQLLNVTKDDKTLVVVISEQIIPDTLDEQYYKEPDWEVLNNEVKNKLYNRQNDNISILDSNQSIKNEESIGDEENILVDDTLSEDELKILDLLQNKENKLEDIDVDLSKCNKIEGDITSKSINKKMVLVLKKILKI